MDRQMTGITAGLAHPTSATRDTPEGHCGRETRIYWPIRKKRKKIKPNKSVDSRSELPVYCCCRARSLRSPLRRRPRLRVRFVDHARSSGVKDLLRVDDIILMCPACGRFRTRGMSKMKIKQNSDFLNRKQKGKKSARIDWKEAHYACQGLYPEKAIQEAELRAIEGFIAEAISSAIRTGCGRGPRRSKAGEAQV